MKQRNTLQKERLRVFMDWKARQHENGHHNNKRSNLQVQYSLSQHSKIHAEAKKKKPQIVEATLSKNNNTRDNTMPDFKIYYMHGKVQ